MLGPYSHFVGQHAKPLPQSLSLLQAYERSTLIQFNFSVFGHIPKMKITVLFKQL